MWLDELKTKNSLQSAKEASQLKCNPKTCKKNWDTYQNIEEEIDKMLNDDLEAKKRVDFNNNNPDCSNLETSSSL